MQSVPSSELEAVVALPCTPDKVALAMEIRSTTLVSSLHALQLLGVEEAYFQQLSPDEAARMRELVPGKWVPMAVGVTHYQAIERLGISEADARANGRRVADNVQNSYFATVIRTLGSAVSLWTALARFPALVGRLVKGGACAVYRVGPNEARVEIHGVPIARFAYVRAGWAGMIEGTSALLARRVAVTDCSAPHTRSVAAFKLRWG